MIDLGFDGQSAGYVYRDLGHRTDRHAVVPGHLIAVHMPSGRATTDMEPGQFGVVKDDIFNGKFLNQTVINERTRHGGASFLRWYALVCASLQLHTSCIPAILLLAPFPCQLPAVSGPFLLVFLIVRPAGLEPANCRLRRGN